MLDRPLSTDIAKVALNRCLDDGSVIYTRHFRDELLNDGLTMEDVLRVCRSGAIARPPEKDIRTGEWKYRIDGRTLEQFEVSVVFSFSRRDRAVMITVFKRTA